jgi:putative membrane protein
MQVPPTDQDSILLEARFDPRLEMYFMLQALFMLAVSFVGILLVPVWFFVGRPVHKRQYDALECELTERTLNFRKGFLFRVQKNVPLDKITDLALREGPILRHLGLCALTVETAGGNAATGAGQVVLVGIIEPIEFRNAVLAQRDKVSLGHMVAPAPASAHVEGGARDAAGSNAAILADIRDSLGRIEGLLAAKNTRDSA